MPWKETDRLSERMEFIAQWQKGRYRFGDLCEVFGISRKTGYKYVGQFEAEGWKGLEDRSHAAHTHPNATDSEVVQRLIEAKQERPRWGPEKLLAWLRAEEPDLAWPAVSTAGAILKRAGLVQPRRPRRAKTHPGRPELAPMVRSHQVDNIDFKGQFRTLDGSWCYPLTMTDSYSRSLLLCRGMLRPTYVATQKALIACFREHGLPEAIRSDNGEPFVSPTTLAGLSRLGVWLIKLGIERIRTRPGSPQDNGLHERMHRTLKQETIIPPAANLRAQQRRFDAFRRDYNEQRPHAALDGATPWSRYERSRREYPERLASIEYPAHFEVRSVRSNGEIKWKGEHLFVSEVLIGERVALEETDDGIWTVRFGTTLLGLLDERDETIVG